MDHSFFWPSTHEPFIAFVKTFALVARKKTLAGSFFSPELTGAVMEIKLLCNSSWQKIVPGQNVVMYKTSCNHCFSYVHFMMQKSGRLYAL